MKKIQKHLPVCPDLMQRKRKSEKIMAIVKLFALNANARKHNTTVTREKQFDKKI